MLKRVGSWLVLVPAVVLLAVGAYNCDQGDAEEGPPLPPQGTMTMEIDLFEQQGAALAFADPGKADGAAAEKSNFNNAAVRVWWLNAAIVAGLSGPVAVFGAALSVEPTYDAGVWTWDFTLNQFQALLTAWFDGKGREGIFLNLEMQVTCPTCKVPTKDFVWYTGRFDTETGEGHWLFYNPEITAADQSFIKIEYSHTDETHKALVFTNVRTDGAPEAGDIVEYLRDGDDASVTVNDKSEALEYTAGWSVSTHAGYLQVPGYNNGEKACWDDKQLNAACPAE